MPSSAPTFEYIIRPLRCSRMWLVFGRSLGNHVWMFALGPHTHPTTPSTLPDTSYPFPTGIGVFRAGVSGIHLRTHASLSIVSTYFQYWLPSPGYGRRCQRHFTHDRVARLDGGRLFIHALTNMGMIHTCLQHRECVSTHHPT
jgi:hypothetical protein